MDSAPELLFSRLIDDAGLFPPARKPMERAAADHRRARAGAHAWILGRFLCPVSRLDGLTGAAEEGWRIGAIFDGDDWRRDLERVRAFAGPGAVRALELRLPADLEDAARVLAATGADVFFEVPPADAPAALEAIAEARAAADALAGAPAVASAGPLLGAKLRCGGLTADAFPSDGAVAGFLRAARGLNVPFKLTAGLHHPFRTRDEAIGVLQHGFLNLLAATALDVEDLEAVVAEEDPGAFTVAADGLRWRGARAEIDALRLARRLFTAYGSCSFDEPVGDLLAAGVLDGAVTRA